MAAAYPFGPFLAALRDQGVGLREQQALALLLQRYDGAERGELRAAVAALLGGDLAGAARVLALFDEFFPVSDSVEEAVAGPAEPPKARSLQRRRWLAGALVGALLGLLGLMHWVSSRPLRSAPTDSQKPQDAGTDKAPSDHLGMPVAVAPQQTQVVPPPSETREPVLPDPPRTLRLGSSLPILALLLGLPLAALLRGRRRGTARWRLQRARLRLRAELSQRPGAHRYRLRFPDLRPPFLDDELDEVSAALLRALLQRSVGSDIDVDRTIAELLRRGALEQILFRSRRYRPALRVLLDGGLRTQVGALRVEALLSGLQRRGVSLRVYHFRDSAAQIAEIQDGPTRPLREVLARDPAAPLWVLSAGGPHLRDGRGRPAAWVEALRTCPRRSWLTPQRWEALWPAAFREKNFPVPVRPLSLRGLLRACDDVLPPDQRQTLPPVPSATPVTNTHVARMQRLVALVPYATVLQAEWLRQRYAADVPEDVLWLLVDRGLDPGGTVLTWPLRVLRGLLADLRQQEGPQREEDVRRGLIELEERSLPSGCDDVAALRCRLEIAKQRLYLPGERAAALVELRALAESAILEEVAAVLDQARLPGEAGDVEEGGGLPLGDAAQQGDLRALRRTVQGRLQTEGEGPVPAEAEAESLRYGLGPPRLGEGLLGTLGLALLGLLLVWRILPRDEWPHQRGYTLIWTPERGGTLRVHLEFPRGAVPAIVTLQDGDQRLRELTLTGLLTTEMSWPAVPFERWLHVQGPVPRGHGELYFSNVVRVPGTTSPDLNPPADLNPLADLNPPADLKLPDPKPPGDLAAPPDLACPPGQRLSPGQGCVPTGRTGTLHVMLDMPGTTLAQVRVAGRALRQGQVELPAGPVELRLDGDYFAVRKTVVVVADQITFITLREPPTLGLLRLRGAPAGWSTRGLLQRYGARLRGPAGAVTLTLSAPGYQDWTAQATVVAGEERELLVTPPDLSPPADLKSQDLKPLGDLAASPDLTCPPDQRLSPGRGCVPAGRTGTLRVALETPGVTLAQVRVAGRALREAQVELPAGPAELRLDGDYVTVSKTVVVVADQVTLITLREPPTLGLLRLRGAPSGWSVRGLQRYGARLRGPAGAVTLTLSAPGYQDWVGEVTVVAGQEREIPVAMERTSEVDLRQKSQGVNWRSVCARRCSDVSDNFYRECLDRCGM